MKVFGTSLDPDGRDGRGSEMGMVAEVFLGAIT